MSQIILNTLVVEDREADLSVLKVQLQRFENIINVCEIATSFDEAISILTQKTFDLSILDIELDNNYDCYELVNLFGKERFGIIAFNTIKTQVPIDKTQKIGRFLLLPKPYSTIGTAKFITELQNEIALLNLKPQSDNDPKNSFIVFSEKNFYIKVPFDNIYFIQGAGTYTEFICKNDKELDERELTKKYLKNGSIGKFEYLLTTGAFIKCDRSHYINVNLIKRINKSEATIHFDLNGKIPSVGYAEWFRDWLDKNGF